MRLLGRQLKRNINKTEKIQPKNTIQIEQNEMKFPQDQQNIFYILLYDVAFT